MAAKKAKVPAKPARGGRKWFRRTTGMSGREFRRRFWSAEANRRVRLLAEEGRSTMGKGTPREKILFLARNCALIGFGRAEIGALEKDAGKTNYLLKKTISLIQKELIARGHRARGSIIRTTRELDVRAWGMKTEELTNQRRVIKPEKEPGWIRDAIIESAWKRFEPVWRGVYEAARRRDPRLWALRCEIITPNDALLLMGKKIRNQQKYRVAEKTTAGLASGFADPRDAYSMVEGGQHYLPYNQFVVIGEWAGKEDLRRLAEKMTEDPLREKEHSRLVKKFGGGLPPSITVRRTGGVRGRTSV